jgi:hypothetical protein
VLIYNPWQVFFSFGSILWCIQTGDPQEH